MCCADPRLLRIYIYIYYPWYVFPLRTRIAQYFVLYSLARYVLCRSEAPAKYIRAVCVRGGMSCERASVLAPCVCVCLVCVCACVRCIHVWFGMGGCKWALERPKSTSCVIWHGWLQVSAGKTKLNYCRTCSAQFEERRYEHTYLVAWGLSYCCFAVAG